VAAASEPRASMSGWASGKRPLLEPPRQDGRVDRPYSENYHQKPSSEDFSRAKRNRYDDGQPYALNGNSGGGAWRPDRYQDGAGYPRRDRSPGFDRSKETYVSRRKKGI
jgi:hypothetical protein